jgi:hypothetical protein
MNDIVVVWLFYPFYTEKANELWVSHYYENLNWAWKRNINDYIAFLQDLSDHYHDNIPIDQNSFVNLLVEMLKEFLPSNMDMDAVWNIDNEYKKIIKEGLFSDN